VQQIPITRQILGKDGEKINKMIIGKADGNLKDKFDIFYDVSKMACVSINPCEDLEYIILNSYKLWDHHNRQRIARMKAVIDEVVETHEK